MIKHSVLSALFLLFSFLSLGQDGESVNAVLLSKAEEAIFNKSYEEALTYLLNAEKNYRVKNSQLLYLKINVLTNLQKKNWSSVDSAIVACDSFFAITKKETYPEEKYMEITNLSLELKEKNRIYHAAYHSLSGSSDIAAIQTFISNYPHSTYAIEFDSTYKQQIQEKIRKEREIAIADSVKKSNAENATKNSKLGDEYFNKKDYENALVYYKKAAEFNDRQSLFQLGNIYLNSLGAVQDEAAALDWYKKAAENILDSTQVLHLRKIAANYYNKKSYPLALEYYKIAAKFEDVLSEVWLGYMYSVKGSIERNDTLSFKWYQKAASQGDATALFALGEIYELGTGVTRDYKMAISYYKKAEDKDNCAAKCKLAKMYFLGQDGTKDYAKSYDLYTQNCNCAETKYYIGLMLYWGYGREQDKKGGLKILKDEALDHPGGKADFFLISNGYKKDPKPEDK